MEHHQKQSVTAFRTTLSPSPSIEFAVVQISNDTVVASNSSATMSPGLSGEVRIWLYSIIFLLSVVGNTLVITTLVQNKRMRTVTNVFLLNLSISDLLLAVFCMPFTLIPTLLRTFIFGKIMCILIRYLQGVCVGVSVFTLVAISLERYFAICQPLRSRSWQTLSHSYKIISFVWFLSLVVMVPIPVFTRLLPLRNGAQKCTELWASKELEKMYMLLLNVVLLLLPLVLMLFAYGKISRTLYRGIQLEIKSAQEMTELRKCGSVNSKDDEVETDDDSRSTNGISYKDTKRVLNQPRRRFEHLRHIRATNTERNLAAKKRVIKMLFAVVLEFFICWTPLYIVNTWIMLDFNSAKMVLTPISMNFIHLLSYVSSCCNPITYCFMNRKFRQAFVSAFRCCGYRNGAMANRHSEYSYATSQRTGNMSPRGSTWRKSRLIAVYPSVVQQ